MGGSDAVKKRYSKVKIVLGSFAASLALIFLWDLCHYKSISALSDPDSPRAEEQLWKTVLGVDGDLQAYIDVRLQMVRAHNKLRDQKQSGKEKKTVFQDFSTAPLHDSADKFIAQLLQYRKQTDQIYGEADGSYKDEVLLYLAQANRYCDLMTLALDARFVGAAKCEKLGNDKLNVFNLYYQKNSGHKFNYDKELMDYFYELPQMQGVCRRCEIAHGGFRLWQGTARKTVFNDIGANIKKRGDDTNPLFYLFLSEVRSAELREQRGSLMSAILKRGVSWAYAFHEWSYLLMALWYQQDTSFCLPAYNWVTTAPDRMWHLSQYAYLSTDNYLWMLKFKDNKPNYRELLQAYSDNLAADLRRCRQKLDSAEFNSLPEMRRAASDLCESAEAILNLGSQYRAGRISDAELIAALPPAEAKYEQQRKRVMKMRWDYLLSWSFGAAGYVKKTIEYEDSVPFYILEEFYKQKGGG